jgi:hypothetical protein
MKSLDEGNILNNEPAEVVDMALQELRRAGVELIEWRAELYRRMNVPIVVMDYSFLVNDDHLSEASEILSDMGLPVSKPSKFLLRTGGDFRAKGYFHRITVAISPGFVQHLVLYPISFSTLDWSEVERPLEIHKTASTTRAAIYIPRRAAVYASLIRMISQTPRYCSTATKLRSDLSELIGYDLLELHNGYVDPAEVGELEREAISASFACGQQKVLQWSRDRAWRAGEEWIGDVLHAIVAGRGDIEQLPWKT